MSDCSRAARLGRLVQSPSVFGIRFSVRTNNTFVIFDLAILRDMSIPALRIKAQEYGIPEQIDSS